MKTFLKSLAWIGIALFAFGLSLSFYTSWIIAMDPHSVGVSWGHMFGLLFGVLGLIFMLIGGLLSKPRYLWLVSIIVGLLYFVSFFSIYQELPTRIRDNQIGTLFADLAISILPGLVAICEGIWLRITEK
jgi:phosphatidylglycerophosphate synthase